MKDPFSDLDKQFTNERARWDRFFKTLPQDHPLATRYPDEHLVEWVESGLIPPGRVLDLGCGNGRNSLYLAEKGFQVEASDISETAIQIAEAKTRACKLSIEFSNKAVFEMERVPGKYDVIYDFGCLHHVHPHRRPQYIDFVTTTLKHGGLFVLGCFNEKMGTSKTDTEILKQFDMEGGISFSLGRLHQFFDDHFEIIRQRPMKNQIDDTMGVGWDYMRVSLWKRF